jgi:23S rRNA (pseudouridine1915-N3)-methyltransferase
MKIRIIYIGKTDTDFLKEGIAEYEKRVKHYVTVDFLTIPATKSAGNLNAKEIKLKESERVADELESSDFVVILDERGKELRSVEFAEFLSHKFNLSIKRLVFIIGGPFGFDDSLKKRANSSLSLSKMTFSHQMVRLIFLEQFYRALTIINHESYHHE